MKLTVELDFDYDGLDDTTTLAEINQMLKAVLETGAECTNTDIRNVFAIWRED